jgi:hypothetical protein
MGKSQEYRAKLKRLRNWVPFLLRESNLPGPRGNLELLQAVADEGRTEQFLAFLAHTAERAPTGTREEFLAACGATGLGERIAHGETGLWSKLRVTASDARWRVREGVAMGLQRVGDRDMPLLLRELRTWTGGGPLERRAVAAGLCEPRLLSKKRDARAVLRILEELTHSLQNEPDRRDEAVRTFRQALGYCWSVAICASPVEGKKRFQRLAASTDPDVRWVIRENLKKSRLLRMDPDWVAGMKSLVA